jgi:diguanylate cyclase (GGDEF)-like protein
MATTDKLTGLNNRQMFDPIFEQMFKYATRNNATLSTVIIDIDNFKKVNDRHGHTFGDEVLIKVAQLIKQSIRDSDVLCRWGGEEFVIAMPNCNGDEALEFAQQLQQNFARHPFTIGQHSIEIQLSIGLSEKSDTDQSSQLIFRADQALLCAKRNGKNQIVTN